MNDIFSADSVGGSYIGWNAKDAYWSINGESADPADLYIDASSFRAGWASFEGDAPDFVFATELGESVDKPSDAYKNAWQVDAYTPEHGDLEFRWYSWSVYKVFKSLWPRIKSQPDGKLTHLKVTSDLVKDKRGNAGPGLEFVGFVEMPPISAPAPAAAADTVF